MCRLSSCQFRALNVQSLDERMNSCAKLIIDEKRTNLSHDLIDKLVILRINLKFTIYCHGKYTSLAKVNVRNNMGNDEYIYADEYD